MPRSNRSGVRGDAAGAGCIEAFASPACGRGRAEGAGEESLAPTSHSALIRV